MALPSLTSALHVGDWADLRLRRKRVSPVPGGYEGLWMPEPVLALCSSHIV
jgi:hypothetical protein